MHELKGSAPPEGEGGNGGETEQKQNEEDEATVDCSSIDDEEEREECEAKSGQMTSNLESMSLSTNPTLNISQYIFLIAFALIFAAVLVAVAVLAKKFRQKITQKLIATKKKFVWNGTIRSISLAYINLCLSAAV